MEKRSNLKKQFSVPLKRVPEQGYGLFRNVKNSIQLKTVSYVGCEKILFIIFEHWFSLFAACCYLMEILFIVNKSFIVFDN